MVTRATAGPSRTPQEIVSRRRSRIVVGAHENFAAAISAKAAKFLDGASTEAVVIRALGREDRDGVLVRLQLRVQVVGIADVQQPAVPLSDRNAAVTLRVSEERDQKDLPFPAEREPASLQPEPLPG